MKRRNFLKSLIVIPAGLLAPWMLRKQVSDEKKEITLLNTNVAGFQYYQGDNVWERLDRGMPLKVCREPSNPYDYDAVALFYGRDKLGYIPRSDNTAIAQLMDRGMSVKASITGLTRSDDPWERMRIAVSMTV